MEQISGVSNRAPMSALPSARWRVAAPLARTGLLACLAVLGALLFVHPSQAQQTTEQLIRDAFSGAIGDGTLTTSERAMDAHLASNPTDDNARFALGMLRFLRSGERMLADIYVHGGFNSVVGASMMMDFGRGPNFAFNLDPLPINNDQWRAKVQRWIDDVRVAEQTLARITDGDVKIRVPIGLTPLDFNADGVTGDGERLWEYFIFVQRRFTPRPADAQAFEIAFDRGDVEWLRGYCNLCMAAGEFILAHDTRDIFERVGHLIFPKNQTPFEFLKGPRAVFEPAQDFDVADMIAFVHLIRLPVVDQPRLERVRLHLLQTITLGKSMWAFYDAETDDDREWIPNPAQSNVVMPNARINAQQREVWLQTLDEGEALFEGRRLLRFWRGDGTQGVNLKRALTEQSEFDLVLWVQGTAAAPFLEVGPFTTAGTWERLEQAFNGTVFRYAWWMN